MLARNGNQKINNWIDKLLHYLGIFLLKILDVGKQTVIVKNKKATLFLPST